MSAPHFLVLTFTYDFYYAVSPPTFTDGVLEFPLRSAYADEHRAATSIEKSSGSYSDIWLILVDSRNGEAGPASFGDP
jgi:hypothetical protein